MKKIDYKKELDKLEIPQDINTSQIISITANISNIYNIAYQEYAELLKRQKRLERNYKLLQKELYLIIKNLGVKTIKTVDDIKSAVEIAISVITLDEVKQNNIDVNKINNALTNASCGQKIEVKDITINKAMIEVEYQLEHIKSVIDILEEKKDSLIIIEGALKLDAKLNQTSTDDSRRYSNK